MSVTRVTYRLGDADLILETGKIGKQANGCVYAQWGGAAIIATICASSAVTEGQDFVPVTVEYNEKFYAAGKIPGGFVKREGRPKDKEILVSRLIDRPMRPLFEPSFGHELQIVPTCVSCDGVHTQDILAVLAASAATCISDIPFHGPVAACRIGYLNGEYIVNPTFEQIEKGELEIVVAGTKEGFTMVEGGANEVSEELMLGALEKAQAFITDMCKLQEELVAKCGKEKLPLNPLDVTLANAEAIEAEATPLLKEACFKDSKISRGLAISKTIKEVAANHAEQLEDPVQAKLFAALMDDIQYKLLRKSILDDGVRVDGRKVDEIRPITCEINVLPTPHGSALFTRGETQSLAVCTLGTAMDEQTYDDIDGDRSEHFILHYNFPPYSVGETGRLTTGRREIGHGNLARRSLAPMIPPMSEFPYTIRVVSEIMESNGSSSQASTCGGCLSLLAAGVPMKKMVAGIAMGLITEPEGDNPYGKYKILSDILGEEDHLGDMDFKVAGTTEGITSIQVDIKVEGLTLDIIKAAFEMTHKGRLQIINDVILPCIPAPRAELNKWAPRIISMQVPVDKIREVIGSGGKVINKIIADTGAQININDDGMVYISSPDLEAADKAKTIITGIVSDPEVGTEYDGTVTRLMDFGAFVEFLPGKEGLVHISKMAWNRVEKVEDVLHEGDKVHVKLIEIDSQGRLNLSIRDCLPKPEGYVEEEPRRRENRPNRERRGGFGGRNNNAGRDNNDFGGEDRKGRRREF